MKHVRRKSRTLMSLLALISVCNGNPDILTRQGQDSGQDQVKVKVGVCVEVGDRIEFEVIVELGVRIEFKVIVELGVRIGVMVEVVFMLRLCLCCVYVVVEIGVRIGVWVESCD